MTLRTTWWITALVALVLAACGGRRDDPILRLSAAEALEQGTALFDQGKYREARKYLIHAFEVEPNSVAGREGLLKAADALFFQDRFDAYVEAETRYRDFLNRFPTSEQAAYAQFRIGGCLAQRVEKPNRDQQVTRRALQTFQDLIRLYPTSEYVDDAREQMQIVRNRLAEHEFIVGHFYFRSSGQNRARGLAQAAANRFEYLLENFPEYEQKDKVLAHLCVAQSRLFQPENARATCSELSTEFPNSKYLGMIPKRFPEPPKRRGDETAARETQESEEGADDVSAGESEESSDPPPGG